MSKKAVVLLSGGIDSTLTSLIAKEWGFTLYALSFNYGQRHVVELRAADDIAEWLNVAEHRILNIPNLGPLTNQQPYVPARNTIFCAFGLGYAETVGAMDIFIGINADDTYFPDCSLRFFTAFNSLATVALKQVVKLNAPLVNLTKAQIIKEGIKRNLPFEKTITCYDGNNCGICPACVTRLKGFADNNYNDLIVYRK